MIYDLIEVICKELSQPEYGFSMVYKDRNFNGGNPPQSSIPCAIVSILNLDQDIYVGGIQRDQVTLMIDVYFKDLGVNVAQNTGGAAQLEKKGYTLADRIQRVFNRQEFFSDEMRCFKSENDLFTRSNGIQHEAGIFQKLDASIMNHAISLQCHYTNQEQRCYGDVQDIQVDATVENNISLI